MDAHRRALAQRDLTDPAYGPHAIQTVLGLAVDALTSAWHCPGVVHRGERVVSVADNYELLGYPADAVTRDVRYTRYVGPHAMLRSHASALVPAGLRRIAAAHYDDVLLACPGIVYRRDSIDRVHTGEPHQVDLWRVRDGVLGEGDLRTMIDLVLAAVLPGADMHLEPAVHPYTDRGLEILARCPGGVWVEVGECGLAGLHVLARGGIDTTRQSGLAMGLGLDRILMLRKGIDDIRLLRSADERIASQMCDLMPYRPVSSMPPVRRDLSVCVSAGATEEEIGDQLRDALGVEASSVEAVALISRTAVSDLPIAARERMGALPGQENILVRVILRSLERSLTDSEANALRDTIYAAIHRGTRLELAGRPGTS